MSIIDELIKEYNNGGIKNERLKGLTEEQLRELNRTGLQLFEKLTA